MSDLANLQATFTAQLPKLKKIAQFHFRHLPPGPRMEAISNVMGLTWMFIYRLFLKGRDGEPGIWNSCAKYACRQVRDGRSVAGCPRIKDVLDGRKGRVKFDDTFDLNDFVGRNTPVFDQVVFRLDVPQFFKTLPVRARKLAKDLAHGMSTSEAARKYQVSAGRISQLRLSIYQRHQAYFAE